MACSSLLTSGFALDCADNIGGIEEILITNVENVTAFTEATGTISAITQATGTSFYIYGLEEEDADFVSTMQKSKENGTLFWETVVNFTIDKLTAAKSEQLLLVAAARNLLMIIKLNDGSYVGLGFDKVNSLPGGLKMIGGTNQAASGKAFADKQGYTLGFTSMEQHMPYFVDAGVVTGLTTA